MRRHLISPLIMLMLAACAAHQSEMPKLTVEAFSGHVTTTSKGSWFTPCGSTEESARWSVTFVDAAVKQANDAKSSGLLGAGRRTFVRWRASRTDERLVGPGGPDLLVRDIFEIRAPKANDCGDQQTSAGGDGGGGEHPPSEDDEPWVNGACPINSPDRYRDRAAEA